MGLVLADRLRAAGITFDIVQTPAASGAGAGAAADAPAPVAATR
jgi:hypothetical protein